VPPELEFEPAPVLQPVSNAIHNRSPVQSAAFIVISNAFLGGVESPKVDSILRGLFRECAHNGRNVITLVMNSAVSGIQFASRHP